MAFPRAARVRFARTSLRDVVCQVRFTPVLRIEQEAPAKVQDVVRKMGFIKYERREVTSIRLMPSLTLPVPVHPQRIEHRFLSKDESFIVLAQDFVAVATSRYQGWERFRSEIQAATRAVVDAYAPDLVTRVGLRYTNVIVRSKLDLTDARWNELLAAELIGMLAAHDDVDAISQQITFAADESGARGRLVHGLVETEEGPGYLLDTDYWREGESSFGDAIASLDGLHTRTWDTFAACLAPRLVAAMQPTSLEE